MKMSSKRKKAAVILAISFIAYNVTLFSLCGFVNHTAVFWVSWIFMLCAFSAMTYAGLVLGQKGLFLRDWLFGFPIVKHSAVYLTVQLIVSGICVLLERSIPWNWAFGLQFLLLCGYGICAVSCFLTKETIDAVHTNVSDKTRFWKILTVDGEMLAEKCADEKVRKMCSQLAQALRYSDPMSSDTLFEIEQALSRSVSECAAAIGRQDFETARGLCNQAMQQLSERNRKCKALK